MPDTELLENQLWFWCGNTGLHITGVLMTMELISLHTCVLQLCVASDKTELYTILLVLILRMEEQ